MQFCASPVAHLYISGTQFISVAEVAKKFGQLMGKEVLFKGTEADSALSVNVSKSIGLLGAPKVALDQLVEWTAHWIGSDKRLLGKSTHFEVRDGKY